MYFVSIVIIVVVVLEAFFSAFLFKLIVLITNVFSLLLTGLSVFKISAAKTPLCPGSLTNHKVVDVKRERERERERGRE